MTRSGSVVVLGSAMMDLVFEAPRRPGPGETLIGTDFEVFLGGKGFNQAVAAARSGAPTSLIGRVGADEFGRRFLDHLELDGIDGRGLMVDDDLGTGVASPVVDPSGENSIVIVPRANSRVSPADVDAAGGIIDTASVLLLQLEVPADAVLAAAACARQAGATVVLNPAPAVADLAPFAGLVDVLVPNEVEAVGLVPGATEPLDAARELHLGLGATVILTVGADGVWVVDGGEPHLVAGHVVDVADTVGAGDAFCGSLGARLAAGDDLDAAVVHANAAAALAVTRRGAEPSMPMAETVGAFLAEPAAAGS